MKSEAEAKIKPKTKLEETKKTNKKVNQKSNKKSFNFLSDKRGISPVVGVLLLLAITVVMAGYLATEVLSYEFQTPSQPVSLNARVENVVVGSSTYSFVRLEHVGGAPLQTSNLKILFNQTEADFSWYKDETFSIGESIAICSVDSNNTAVLMYPISQSTKKPSGNILKTGESAELIIIDSSNNQIIYKKTIYAFS